MTRFSGLLACFALLALLGAWGGCKRTAQNASAAPDKPTLRLVAVSTLAGALEPCGCVKDMLGGVDHAAALIRSERTGAEHTLVVGAGPLFFMDPALMAERKTQDVWKAEAIAKSLHDVGLAAWAPGLNDWAAGAERLAALAKSATATPLAANLKGAPVAEATRVVEAGGIKVGIAGVSAPLQSGKSPDGVTIEDARAALERAKRSLDERGAGVRVALVALPRGDALRIAETVPGYQVMVVGKPYDQGEANDGETPPVLVGDTLVVQAPNHLQGVAIVDLFVRGGSTSFGDGSGVRDAERRASLERRSAELEKRLAEWEKPGSKVSEKDVAARRSDLERLKKELAALKSPEAPKQGSFFRYRLVDVAQKLGTDPAVAERMQSFYKRVNDHNKIAFADRKPPAVPEGQSSYVGIEQCSACHAEERAFWDKTRHAKAYATLAVQHKQFNLECVGCHVTGYEKPGGSTVTHVENLVNVQCENCHGPGSRHPNDPANPELIVKKPAKSLCAPECHHPPHVKSDWSVDEAWKKILGPGHGG